METITLVYFINCILTSGSSLRFCNNNVFNLSSQLWKNLNVNAAENRVPTTSTNDFYFLNTTDFIGIDTKKESKLEITCNSKFSRMNILECQEYKLMFYQIQHCPNLLRTYKVQKLRNFAKMVMDAFFYFDNDTQILPCLENDKNFKHLLMSVFGMRKNNNNNEDDSNDNNNIDKKTSLAKMDYINEDNDDNDDDDNDYEDIDRYTSDDDNDMDSNYKKQTKNYLTKETNLTRLKNLLLNEIKNEEKLNAATTFKWKSILNVMFDKICAHNGNLFGAILSGIGQIGLLCLSTMLMSKFNYHIGLIIYLPFLLVFLNWYILSLMSSFNTKMIFLYIHICCLLMLGLFKLVILYVTHYNYCCGCCFFYDQQIDKAADEIALVPHDDEIQIEKTGGKEDKKIRLLKI